MIAVLFGSLAAVANAGQALISKELTLRAPRRQLIGVLYVGNCLVLLPFAPFAAWVWSPTIVLLHLVSVALMVVTAICVWPWSPCGVGQRRRHGRWPGPRS